MPTYDGIIIFKSPTKINVSRDPDIVLMEHATQVVRKYELKAIADFLARGWVVAYSTPEASSGDEWDGMLGSNPDDRCIYGSDR